MTSQDQLLTIVRDMRECDLIVAVRTLDKKLLRRLWRLAGIRDCDCPVEILPCECDGEHDANCHPVIKACRCGEPWRESLLPLSVQAAILHALNPTDYADRPPPRAASATLLPAGRVKVLAERERCGEGLWHPEDLFGRGEDFNDRLGRLIRRGRNGIAQAETKVRAVEAN